MIAIKKKKAAFYYTRQMLYRITIQMLLGYHTPLGNTNRVIIAREMMGYIICQRKDLFILKLPFTAINLRKALGAIYKEGSIRGTLLIYASSLKKFFYEDNATFLFVKTWIGGLLTNFKVVARRIQFNHYIYRLFGFIFLTRPQIFNLLHVQYQFKSLLRALLYKRSLLLKVPSLALSVNNDDVWSNELRCAGIPSIQILDIDTPTISFVGYGVLGNQASVSLAKLLCDLTIESCGKGMLSEHVFKLHRKKSKQRTSKKAIYFLPRRFKHVKQNVVRRYGSVVCPAPERAALIERAWHELYKANVYLEYTLSFAPEDTRAALEEVRYRDVVYHLIYYDDYNDHAAFCVEYLDSFIRSLMLLDHQIQGLNEFFVLGDCLGDSQNFCQNVLLTLFNKIRSQKGLLVTEEDGDRLSALYHSYYYDEENGRIKTYIASDVIEMLALETYISLGYPTLTKGHKKARPCCHTVPHQLTIYRRLENTVLGY